VTEGGLPQVGRRRRHASLVMNLQFSILMHASLVMNLQFSILMAQTTDPSSWR
jgi:hypothetical protein